MALRDPMVSALDARAPGWRGATAVQARLSAFDGTRDEGLERMLLAVGRGAVEARLSGADAEVAAAVRAFIDEALPSSWAARPTTRSACRRGSRAPTAPSTMR
ncbi:MAG: hypothetical protein R3A52_30645 [Polyangiales bacterium]